MTLSRFGPLDDPSAREEDLRAVLDDIVEALRLVDGAALGEVAQRQLGRAMAASRAALRLLEADGTARSTDLVGLLRDLEDRWGGRAAARDLALALSVAPDVPRWLPVDQVSLERLLSKLLAHALAGVEAGSVRLAVECSADDLVFTIHGNGTGFRDHAEADAALAAAEALAEALAARLEPGPRSSEGPRLRLALPRGAWDRPVPEARDDGDLSGLRIGLAGLPEAEAVALADIVAAGGGGVDRLPPGGDPGAMSLSVLVLDADAPGAADLLAATRGHSVAVVAVTAAILAVHRAGLADAGADALLARPLPEPEVVLRTLRTAVASRLGTADGNDQATLDPSRLERLLDLAGPELAGELLDRLIDDLGVVARGIAAAAPDRDGTALRAHTHVLISLSGAVGADRLQWQAEALNRAAHADDAPTIERLAAGAARELDQLVAHVEAVRTHRKAAR